MDLTGTDTDDSAAAPRGVSGGATQVPRASDAAAGMGLGVAQVDGAEAVHGEGRPTAAADSRAEARAEAADRVRDALRNGRTAVQDVGEYSDGAATAAGTAFLVQLLGLLILLFEQRCDRLAPPSQLHCAEPIASSRLR